MTDGETLEQIVESWRTNQRILGFLLDEISPTGFAATLSTRGGRSVARQFAHLHNVRVWALEKRARDLSADLRTFATREEPDRETLRQNLEQSAERVERFFREALAGVP